jgi:hypothetical protein
MLSETFYGGYLPYHITILPSSGGTVGIGDENDPSPNIRSTRNVTEPGSCVHPSLDSC